MHGRKSGQIEKFGTMDNKTQNIDIVIIGAGAAGLMAAIGAAQVFKDNGHSVFILEKMEKPGRKIAITGKGRCNFTNVKPWNEFSSHVHPNANLLKSAFYNLTPEKLIDFLAAEGLESVVERGDRAYPASYKSWDVIDTLTNAAKRQGVEIHPCSGVTKVIHINAKDSYSDSQNAEGNCKATCPDGIFEVMTADGEKYTCKALIIATGGLAYPATGSTGDGYSWAREMGHSLTERFPSLTALVPKGYKLPDQNIAKDGRQHIDRSCPLSENGRLLCGNQLKNIGLSLIIDGNAVQDEFGDIDFTDGGLEGPIGFKISRRCVKALINGGKAAVCIDLKPAVSETELQHRIYGLWKNISEDKRSHGHSYNDKFKVLLGKLLPKDFIPAFLAASPKADHNNLGRCLKNMKLDIDGYVGFERCVITAGGIQTKELNPKTLESKFIHGLYFAGEILDLDADTGGYNLHIAFSTGYLAGQSAAKALL